MGPKGFIQLQKGVIRHERHVHIGPSEAAYYGVKDGERLNLRVQSDCSAVLENLLVRQARRRSWKCIWTPTKATR